MGREEILAAVRSGRAEFPIREREREAARAEAEMRRQRALPMRIAVARTFLDLGAVARFVEEMSARGAIDAVMMVGDPVLELLWNVTLDEPVPDLEVLAEALVGMDGVRARLRPGPALEVVWDQPDPEARR